jgi:hypothetical protein
MEAKPRFYGDRAILVRQTDHDTWLVSWVAIWPHTLLDTKTLREREFEFFADASAFIEGELL